MYTNNKHNSTNNRFFCSIFLYIRGTCMYYVRTKNFTFIYLCFVLCTCIALSSTYFQLSKVHVCTFPHVICVACTVHVVRSVHTRVSGIRVCTTRGCARITQAQSRQSHKCAPGAHCVIVCVFANSDIVI
jgi:hypothetical protein